MSQVMKVAMLHGTCVGEVNWLTQGVFHTQGFVHDAHGGARDEGKVLWLEGTYYVG